MNAKRHPFVRSTTATLIAAMTALTLGLALGISPGAASATVPPTVPPAGTSTDSTVASTDGSATPTSVELVESWTLTPGGSDNGDAAGSRPNLTYQLAPGAVVHDSVIVFNLGNVPLDFKVYSTDAFNNADGEFDLLAGDATPVDAGSWVTFAQNGITLPPGKQATIPITVSVPLDASPGDHVGAIVASNVAVSDNGGGQVVNVDRRTGTRLYIQVDGPLKPELAIAQLQTDYHHAVNSFGGSADVTFRVENRGNVRLTGTPTVSVSGPFGIGKRSVTLPALSELLPGQHVDLHAKLDGVAALLLDSTTVRVVPGASSAGDATAATGNDTTFAPPITVLLILVLLLCGLMVFRAYRRHRRAGAAAPPPAPIRSGQSSDEAEHALQREPQHQ